MSNFENLVIMHRYTVLATFSSALRPQGSNGTINPLNCQVSLKAMAMCLGGKYMTTYLESLDLPGGKSNRLHHVLKVVDDKIRPIIQQVAQK